MAAEYLVIERVVQNDERHPDDRSNPGFAGVDVESMMLVNYARHGWRLVSVISAPASGMSASRRVFYFVKEE